MIEICIGTTVVQSILDVIFQRIEKTSDMETAAHETQFARSQIMGMRRIVAAGDEAVSGGQGRQRGGNECQLVMTMLDAALEKLGA